VQQRVLHSYDRISLDPDHVTRARILLDLYDLSRYDNNTPRQIILLLRQHLCRARRREEIERQRNWRPLR
jgi:hypothetical protein